MWLLYCTDEKRGRSLPMGGVYRRQHSTQHRCAHTHFPVGEGGTSFFCWLLLIKPHKGERERNSFTWSSQIFEQQCHSLPNLPRITICLLSSLVVGQLDVCNSATFLNNTKSSQVIVSFSIYFYFKNQILFWSALDIGKWKCHIGIA